MTLTSQQIRGQVLDYLEATECQLIEVAPTHITVKLSPRADRMLTDRPYYWGFVERTGAEPETLSFTFVFEPERYDSEPPPAAGDPRGPASLPQAGGVSLPAGTAGAAAPGGTVSGTGAPQDTILGRYFGIVPALPRFGPGMIRREDLIYGSKRLRQIWAAAREEGKCLCLFETPGSRQRTTLLSAAYEPWLGVCYKVEMACDLKREELHFIGISLVSGRVIPDFTGMLNQRELTPRLPENVHIQPYGLSIAAGAERLEGYLTGKLAALDYGWAEEARERLAVELEIVDLYYAELLKEPDEQKKQEIEAQYNRRRQETAWQYEPQIAVSAIIYGLFHLRST